MNPTRSIRGRLRPALWSAALFALAGCDLAERLPGTDAVVAVRDSQYEIAVEFSSPDSADSVGELRVHVEPRNGWKFALEAPASLHVEDPAGFEFDDASDPTSHSIGHLEFTRTFRADGPGDTLAKGHIKFGICEGDESLCVLVKREVDLPLKVAFAEPQ
jgi:hypothetical protein